MQQLAGMGTRAVGRARTHRLRPVLGIALACLGLMLGVSAVSAADNPEFGIRPANPTPETTIDGYFALKAQAGDTLRDAVVVANPGSVPIKILLYAVDATSGQNGGVIYLNKDARRGDVGAWVTLEDASVDVPPRQQTTVNFTMNLPNATDAGQHIGGIVAQLVPADASATAAGGDGKSPAFGVTTVTRAVVAVLVSVGGQPTTASLKITGAQLADVDGLPTLTLALQNDGSSLLKANGDVTLLDAKGASVLSKKLALDTLVPRTSISYPVQADPPSVPGTYKVHVALDFGGAAPAVFDGSVSVMEKPTPTAITPGRQRPPAAAANPEPTADSAATTSASASGISPTSAALGGVAGALAILVIGWSIFIVRSRRAK